MAASTDTESRLSTIGFFIRLVTSIVVPVAAIGVVLWWLVARDQLDQAVEHRAIAVSSVVSNALDGDLENTSELRVTADRTAIRSSIADEIEPTLGTDVALTILGLDGTAIFTDGAIDDVSLDIVDGSVFRGVASGRILESGETTSVAYSIPLSVDGRTLAVARLDIGDDAIVASAEDDAARLIYLFGGALLAITVALVPLCWWSLGEVRRQYRKTRTLAMSDALTGLANRTQFHERLDEAIAGAGRSDGRVGLVMLDLDGFKAINDTGGHAAGDRLLKRVAAALGEATRRHEVACRLGGDEFAVVAPRIDDRDELRGLADRLHKQLDLPVEFSDGRTLRVTASLGLALYPDDAVDSDDLVNVADASMYSVKAARKAKLPDGARARAASGRR